MISDVLSDAVDQIEDYAAKMPDVYEGMDRELDVVVMTMTLLRIVLDMPPGYGEERVEFCLRTLGEIGALFDAKKLKPGDLGIT